MCLLAYRIHSIFVLRLFNDPIAMTFLYISIAFLLRRQWAVACILYRFEEISSSMLVLIRCGRFSLAVSIKMNIILMAPALFFILLLSVGLRATFQYILYCALLQVGSYRLLRWWVTLADRSSFSLRCRFYSRILLLTLPGHSTSAVSSSTSGRSIGVWYPKISFSIVTFISAC